MNVRMRRDFTTRVSDGWKERTVPHSIADCGLRIVDCGLWIADCGLRIADCGLRIVDCGNAQCAFLRHPTYGRMARPTKAPIRRRRNSLAILPWLSGWVLNFTRTVAAPSESDSMPMISSGSWT